MTCASCVRRVEKALEKVEGVHGVAVNLATETATVTADDVVTPETLRSAVEKAGYEAGAIDRPLPASPAANSDDDISLTFDIEGMTCASCVRRVEKALEKVEGVHNVSVNLATETASVHIAPTISAETLKAAVTAAGYGAGEITIPTKSRSSEAPATQSTTERDAAERDRKRDAHIHELKLKSLVSLTIGAIMMVLMYVPLPISERTLGPLLLIAATFVQVWAGREFTPPPGPRSSTVRPT
ncbi:MAG: copper ion binding protein [Thermomicrobiales bacterium]|nr:copper ion binding protein [Thermomicrobiales bacterium]